MLFSKGVGAFWAAEVVGGAGGSDSKGVLFGKVSQTMRVLNQLVSRVGALLRLRRPSRGTGEDPSPETPHQVVDSDYEGKGEEKTNHGARTLLIS